jgi:glycosyltransferase involved in cell wall biosynthesis
MATYNGSKYIFEQINSILPQMKKEDELIISDNGSTDETLQIIASFQDKRIKVHHFSSTQNLIFNFENAILQSKGDYIFLCDQDDIWMSNRVEEGISLLQNSDLAVSNCSIVDQSGNVTADSFFLKYHSGPGLAKNLLRNTYIGCCMCFKRKLLTLVLPFPKGIPMHDIWIGFVAELFYKVTFANIVLLQYRRHEANASNFGKSNAKFFKQFMYRFNTLKYLPVLLLRRSKNYFDHLNG